MSLMDHWGPALREKMGTRFIKGRRTLADAMITAKG